MTAFKLECVLFDLDGTLVDTAPDLIACLNRALAAYGFETVEPQQIKHLISLGAMPMIKHAVPQADADLQQLMLDFMLDSYQQNIAAHSRFYAGMPETLAHIEQLGLKWGVVTNP